MAKTKKAAALEAEKAAAAAKQKVKEEQEAMDAADAAVAVAKAEEERAALKAKQALGDASPVRLFAKQPGRRVSVPTPSGGKETLVADDDGILIAPAWAAAALVHSGMKRVPVDWKSPAAQPETEPEPEAAVGQYRGLQTDDDSASGGDTEEE